MSVLQLLLQLLLRVLELVVFCLLRAAAAAAAAATCVNPGTASIAAPAAPATAAAAAAKLLPMWLPTLLNIALYILCINVLLACMRLLLEPILARPACLPHCVQCMIL